MLTEIPKIMHFYWDKSKLSYLQYMTIVSFNKFNPDWQIILHEPKKPFYGDITWKTGEQELKYDGYNWYYDLKNLKYINFNEVDFEKIGFTNEIPEVYKSDFLRWYLLSTDGGGWSDMDILYLKSLDFLNIGDSDTVICLRKNIHIIGFFLSIPNNIYFKKIVNLIDVNFDRTKYQSIGSTLLNQLYPKGFDKNLPNKMKIIDSTCFYPFSDTEIDKIFSGINLKNLSEDTIGIHWYNGSNISKQFNNFYDYKTKNINNTITELINKFI
jgi:hypothetical protein